MLIIIWEDIDAFKARNAKTLEFIQKYPLMPPWD